MCLGPEALFLLGTAATVGGTAVNASAQRKVAKERDRKIAEENVRQQQLGRENDALLSQTLGQFTAPQQAAGTAQAVQAREQALLPQGPAVPVMYDAGSPAAPKEVKTELAAKLADAIRKGRTQIKSMATLQGAGDANMNRQRDLSRALTQGGMIRNFQDTSSSVVPYELEQANQVGRGRTNVADALSAGGSIAQLYALTRPPVKTPVPIEERTFRPRTLPQAH